MFKPSNVRHHIAAMQKRGFSRERVLAGTGISAARLGDPGTMVTLEQCHAVVDNMLRLTGNPALGLDIGLETPLTDLGIVGYAIASAATMGQAVNIWVQYGNSPVGFPFTLRLIDVKEDEGWGVTASPIGIGGAVFRFYFEETLAIGLSLGPVLLGRPFKLDELSLSYAAPPHWRRYEELFDCTIRFDAPETRLIARSPRLDAPALTGDSEMRELCIRHCSSLLRQIGRGGAVSTRLRGLLRARGGIPSLDEAAAGLAMSPRSLRRHLASEGSSFQAVLDEFRCDLAREYLGTGMMPAKEVADLLGFSQTDAFRRAFKTWTGQTVGEFQALGRASPAETAESFGEVSH